MSAAPFDTCGSGDGKGNSSVSTGANLYPPNPAIAGVTQADPVEGIPVPAMARLLDNCGGTPANAWAGVGGQAGSVAAGAGQGVLGPGEEPEQADE